MNNQNSFLKSMAGSAKTGTWVFGIFSLLELASVLVEKLFYAMSVPVWNAWDRYAAKTKAAPAVDSGDGGEEKYPSGEEMFASLPAEFQLRYAMHVEDERGKKGTR